MSTHHTSDPVCPACEEKLTQAHDKLAPFFKYFKSIYPDLHVSWSYRDKQSQEEAVKNHKSDLHYPKSPHNKLPALAIDVFQINEHGAGIWDGKFCAKLNKEQKAAGFDLLWGGEFKDLGDADHFQVNAESSSGVERL